MGLYYRGIINRAGATVLLKCPEIPDAKLMVGSAENLASVPLLLYNDLSSAIPKPLTAPIDQMKNEDVRTKLNGETLTVDDFVNNTFYVGRAVGGY